MTVGMFSVIAQTSERFGEDCPQSWLFSGPEHERRGNQGELSECPTQQQLQAYCADDYFEMYISSCPALALRAPLHPGEKIQL